METTHEGQFKLGLLKLKMGAQITVPATPGGKRMKAVTVGDKTRHPKAAFTVVCVKCRKEFAGVNELLAEHPSHEEMVEAGESHPWCFHSDELAEAAPKGATKEEIASLPKIGFVSDEIWR